MKKVLILASIIMLLSAIAYAETLTLPASLEVVEEEAFYGDTSLDAVILPEGITEIQANAFAKSSLSSINLPSTLTTIGEGALPAPGTVEVTATEGSWAYEWAVENGYIELTEYAPATDFTVSNGVIIEYHGPGGDIIIPPMDANGNPITGIGSMAFYSCNDLTSVTLPHGITNIEEYAFEHCWYLTKVSLSDSVVSIGQNAFCASELSEIEVDPANVNFSSREGILYDYTMSTLLAYPRAKPEKEHSYSFEVPDGVRYIGDYAFEGCGLFHVTIPDSVVGIGNHAFESCNLAEITIPASITSMGSEAFAYSGLRKAVIQNGITSISEEAFLGCDYLMQVEIPETVTSICDAAFKKCSNLMEISLPADLTAISDSLFEGCENLQYIMIPKNVTSIGDLAFADCGSLSGILIPEKVTSIGDAAFWYCSNLIEVSIPESVTNIGGAFAGCSSLTDVTLPEGITVIKSGTFYGCSSLTDISIPEAVTSIGDEAFSYCSSLTSIRIPTNVSWIGAGAFEGCTALMNVTFDESTDPWREIWINRRAFYRCNSLTSIDLRREHEAHIYEEAFYGCSSLTSVTLPNCYRVWISKDAFSECSNLTSLYISCIDLRCFEIRAEDFTDDFTLYCNEDYIDFFRERGFRCQLFVNGNIVDSEKHIAAGALREGEGWAINWKIAYDEDDWGNKTNAQLYLYLQGYNPGDGSLLLHSQLGNGFLMPWLTDEYGFTKEMFTRISIYGGGSNPFEIVSDTFSGYVNVWQLDMKCVSAIQARAFEGCVSLFSVRCDSTLKSVGDAAFRGCTEMKRLDGSNRLEMIGDEAFANTSLNSMTLGEQEIQISNSAFAGCSDLVITCFMNSYAYQYAIENGIPFEIIERPTVYCFGHDIRISDLLGNVSLEDYLRKRDARAYNPKIAYILSALARAVYDKDEIDRSLASLGFVSRMYANYGSDDGLAAHYIAKKEMRDGSLLVLVVIRGSSNIPNWIGNLAMAVSDGITGFHAGFELSEKNIYQNMEAFLGGIPTSNVTYVVTGHSLGGGVGNLLCVKLSDAGVPSSRVFDYNFACPDVARGLGTRWNYAGEHDNIFNISDVRDPVSYIPGVLGEGGNIVFTWGKYGRSYWFSHDWSQYTLLDFGAHDMDNYVYYMSKLNNTSDFRDWLGAKAAQGATLIDSILSIFPQFST